MNGEKVQSGSAELEIRKSDKSLLANLLHWRAKCKRKTLSFGKKNKNKNKLVWRVFKTADTCHCHTKPPGVSKIPVGLNILVL